MGSAESGGCPATTMFLLPRLAKQVMRRSNPERLGLDLRLVMALSYLDDHDDTPRCLQNCFTDNPLPSCSAMRSRHCSAFPRA